MASAAGIPIITRTALELWPSLPRLRRVLCLAPGEVIPALNAIEACTQAWGADGSAVTRYQDMMPRHLLFLKRVTRRSALPTTLPRLTQTEHLHVMTRHHRCKLLPCNHYAITALQDHLTSGDCPTDRWSILLWPCMIHTHGQSLAGHSSGSTMCVRPPCRYTRPPLLVCKMLASSAARGWARYLSKSLDRVSGDVFSLCATSRGMLSLHWSSGLQPVQWPRQDRARQQMNNTFPPELRSLHLSRFHRRRR